MRWLLLIMLLLCLSCYLQKILQHILLITFLSHSVVKWMFLKIKNNYTYKDLLHIDLYSLIIHKFLFLTFSSLTHLECNMVYVVMGKKCNFIKFSSNTSSFSPISEKSILYWFINLCYYLYHLMHYDKMC